MKIKILGVYFNTPCEKKIVRIKEEKSELHQKIEKYIKDKIIYNKNGKVQLLHINKITVKIKISGLILFIEYNDNVYSIGLSMNTVDKQNTYLIYKKPKEYADNTKRQPRKRHKEIT